MKMSVYEFTNLFVEEDKQKFIVFNTESGEDIFNGFKNEMPDKILWCEVSSIDNLNGSEIITINI